NNEGVEEAVGRLKNRKSNIIVGGNIGKNKVTSNENALDDYLICFEKLYDYVDYFVVNVSSPNTPELRELQEKEPLMKLLKGLHYVNNKRKLPKPILLKIAPDLIESQLDDIIDITKQLSLDGLIVSNTTIDRSGLTTNAENIEAIGAGGLSGKPVFNKSNEVLKYIRRHNPTVHIVAVGGVHSGQDAVEKIRCGANLVQIYTGLVYEGPSLVKRINKELLKHV
ncbi:MAG: quinone-dependent dihydroorotate dehydrogenase, partial [Ekhidna sp.]